MEKTGPTIVSIILQVINREGLRPFCREINWTNLFHWQRWRWERISPPSVSRLTPLICSFFPPFRLILCGTRSTRAKLNWFRNASGFDHRCEVCSFLRLSLFFFFFFSFLLLPATVTHDGRSSIESVVWNMIGDKHQYLVSFTALWINRWIQLLYYYNIFWIFNFTNFIPYRLEFRGIFDGN